MKQALLELAAVRYVYPRSMPLISGLSLCLAPGQVHVVRGENGSGKTTVLKLAAGMLRPLSGEVHSSAVRTYVGADTNFHESLTVFEEVQYLASFGTIGEAELLRALEIWGFDVTLLHTDISNLSSGWRQRLALGLGSAANRDVLLLDEPFANLDAEGVNLTLAWISNVVGRDGAAIIVHHGELGELAQYSPAVLTMERRKISLAR